MARWCAVPSPSFDGLRRTVSLKSEAAMNFEQFTGAVGRVVVNDQDLRARQDVPDVLRFNALTFSRSLKVAAKISDDFFGFMSQIFHRP